VTTGEVRTLCASEEWQVHILHQNAAANRFQSNDSIWARRSGLYAYRVENRANCLRQSEVPMTDSELYIALVNAGLPTDEAAKLAASNHVDLEGALVATLRKLTEVQRALDKLEDGIAESMGKTRTKRFAPRPERANEP
jgi:hypothetical protein